MGLVGTLDIPRDCISGGRASLHSDTREHSTDDGNCFWEFVMCKTHGRPTAQHCTGFLVQRGN